MYIASIVEIDNDYRSYSGTSEIKVSSWEDAEKYCKEESWSGFSYLVENLRRGKEFYWDKTEWKNRVL